MLASVSYKNDIAKSYTNNNVTLPLKKLTRRAKS